LRFGAPTVARRTGRPLVAFHYHTYGADGLPPCVGMLPREMPSLGGEDYEKISFVK